MNFFSKSSSGSSTKQKPPSEVVRSFLESAARLDSANGQGTDIKRINDDLVRSLRSMKSILSDPPITTHSSDLTIDAATELSQLIFQHGLLRALLQTMPRMEFEAKKEGSSVFGLLLRRQVGTRYPAVNYVCRERYLIVMALRG